MSKLLRSGSIAGLVVCAVAAGSASAAPVNLDSNLQLYYSMDDISGSTVPDNAGATANNGTLTSGSGGTPPSIVAGKFGSALSFSAANKTQVNINTAGTDLTLGNTMTISMWVQLTTLPSATNTTQSIFDSSQDSYVVYVDGGNHQLRFKVTDTSGGAARVHVSNTDAVNGGIATNTWLNVIGTYDGTGVGTKSGITSLYVNGTQVFTQTGGDSSGNLSGNIKTGQVPFLGNDPNSGAGTTYFTGLLDDVGVWNRVLNADEIAYIAAGNAIPEPASVSLLCAAGGMLLLRRRRGGASV